MATRKYTLRRRAEAQEQTRGRIVEAAMALHEEVGPARTTISAVAERAGVERLTVYRHFRGEPELFAACSSLYVQLHPPPDPASWQTLADRRERTLRALHSTYAYYRSTQRMWRQVIQDEEKVPALGEMMVAFRREFIDPLRKVPALGEMMVAFRREFIDPLRDDLLRAWRPTAAVRRLLKQAIGHAIDFTTWQSLHRQGLGDREMASLMLRWIEAAAVGRGRGARPAGG